MPLQATSGAASYDAFGGGVPVVPTFIEDIFSCFLYTGNRPSTQTVTNGIDLSGKGGLVWVKNRASASFPQHTLFDTARGAGSGLSTNSTDAQDASYTQSFSSTGFTLGGDNGTNQSGITYCSWSFRKQPKFFDVVTYTGTGSNTTIAHNLGSVPGSIIVKRTDTTAAWAVYHRSLANTQYLVLNTTAAAATGATWWNSTTPTSSVFSVGTDASVNASGGTYIAYVFAHDAGGFGLTGTDNVISCGSFTGNTTVNLGYEPQWVLLKRTDGTSNWFIFDNMRGLPADVALSNTQALFPNVTSAESGTDSLSISSTGFTGNLGAVNYIYIAIRRGPMKVPTSGTSVYSANRYQYDSGYGGGLTTTTVSGAAGGYGGFPTDLVINTIRNQSGDLNRQFFLDRLRGIPALWSTQTYAESSPAPTGSDAKWDNMVGVTTSGYPYYVYTPYIFTNFFFRRAPSFMDVVCYTGTGANRTVAHNLGVTPELMIVKSRSNAFNWSVYDASNGATNYLYLNLVNATSAFSGFWNDTSPTASVFSVGGIDAVNGSGYTYVAYLFATCAGVSKVGSYTGNGSTQTINCGFTGGARWVMIKRTDSTGDWLIWDTVDGMVAGTSNRIAMNSTAAEANNNFVYTASTGFEIVTSDAAINASGGSYIFLAIA